MQTSVCDSYFSNTLNLELDIINDFAKKKKHVTTNTERHSGYHLSKIIKSSDLGYSPKYNFNVIRIRQNADLGWKNACIETAHLHGNDVTTQLLRGHGYQFPSLSFRKSWLPGSIYLFILPKSSKFDEIYYNIIYDRSFWSVPRHPSGHNWPKREKVISQNHNPPSFNF